jgi:N-acetylneuraminic acid mutarotase
MVSYKDTLVVFGGELANGTLLNDLWIFNISTTTWRRLYGSDHPPGLASHCATVHGDELILFGGMYHKQQHASAHNVIVRAASGEFPVGFWVAQRNIFDLIPCVDKA